MYGISEKLDLSKVIGESMTMIRVGKYDIQFPMGEVTISTQSNISLIKNGIVIGKWSEGSWPDKAFHDLINIAVVNWKVEGGHILILVFDNGVEMNIYDDSDQYETIVIDIKDQSIIII